MIALCLSFLAILCGGMCEGVMDALQFHYPTSKFSKFPNVMFWDAEQSWRNKYKNGEPKDGERFLFSTTLLVGFTDAWHLFKLIRNVLCFTSLVLLGFLSVTLMHALVYLLISRILYGIGFWITYD